MSFEYFFIDVVDLSSEGPVFRGEVSVGFEHIGDNVFDSGKNAWVIRCADEEELNVIFGLFEGFFELFGIEVEGVDICGHSGGGGFGGDTDGSEVSKELGAVLSFRGKDGSNLVFEAGESGVAVEVTCNGESGGELSDESVVGIECILNGIDDRLSIALNGDSDILALSDIFDVESKPLYPRDIRSNGVGGRDNAGAVDGNNGVIAEFLVVGSESFNTVVVDYEPKDFSDVAGA